MAGKVSKASVGYRRAPLFGLFRRCGNCSMFRDPGRCTLVAGHIDPGDVCDEWEPRRPPGAATRP
jgi:hypothetical protein